MDNLEKEIKRIRTILAENQSQVAQNACHSLLEYLEGRRDRIKID